MLRNLIGSSNVYRTYNYGDFREYPEFKMIKCTNKEVFKVALEQIGEGKGETTVSVIENLLCDAVRDINDSEAKNTALENSIKEYLETIKKAAIKRPEVKFALVQPTLRPAHQWFTEGHEAFCRKISEGIRLMDLGNVGKIEGPIKMSQVFEDDGIHFTKTSGKVFVNAILYNADAYFTAEVINLEEEKEMDETVQGAGTVAKSGQATKITPTDLKTEIGNLRNDIIRRRVDDCLVTARIREELDQLSNTRKEDRIIVTGMTSQIPMPVGIEEKKKWLKDLVGGILNQVELGSSEFILNVMQGWKGTNTIPLAEVRMNSSELATRIRKQFAAKKKAGHDFGRVYLANSVTLGTRVRIDILKAMAKCFAGEKEIMYVSAFTSRPLLHVKPKEAGSRTMAYTFADALSRYGMHLRQVDLGEAYRRAGTSFKGQMQQNFVVLHDSQPPCVAPWVRTPARGGRGGATNKTQHKRKLVNGDRRCDTPEKKKK